MDWTRPADLESLRDRARAFTAEVLTPAETALPPAEGALPPGLRERAANARRAAGLWHLTVPAAEGGAGHTWLERAVVQEEVHKSLLGLWPLQLLSTGEPPAPLYAARGDQRDRYLQPCLDGRRIAHQLLPHPGTLQVRAVQRGALLDGRCAGVPAFAAADLLIVVADLRGRPCGFLCEPDLARYRITRRRPGMGSTELVDLEWEDCLLDDSRILPDVGAAARLWQAGLRATTLAAGAVGAAERCLRAAIDRAQSRHTFGKPLAERQAIQWLIADSARELHAARLLAWRAAALADRGEDPALAAAAAQAYATDVACRIVDRVIQIHGGLGYTRDLPFERYWRELRYYRLAEGGSLRIAADSAAALVADLHR